MIITATSLQAYQNQRRKDLSRWTLLRPLLHWELADVSKTTVILVGH
jgi:hypothetical protein